MSPTQPPVCVNNTHTRPRVVRSCSETLYYLLTDEEDSRTSRRVESVVKYKLPTYQAAAVVSTVLAGVESQLLVFFKSTPDFLQESTPAMLQALFILTYISLIFSVSSTISSLVLIKNFGNVPMLAARFQEKVKRLLITPRPDPATAQSRFSRDIAPWRWRLIEWHWLFTLVISVLCLPTQIILYIWMQERDGIRVTVSVAGVFSMLPLLHFLPIHRKRRRYQGKLELPHVSHALNSENSAGYTVRPASISSPPAIYAARPASTSKIG